MESNAAATAKRWYQVKRMPLYLVVGGTFAGAAIFFYNNAQHPHVETNTAIRKDGLAEERDSMAQEGHETKESMGRKFSRDTGMHQGMNTDGIFPNTKIAKKMGDVLGTTPSKPDSK